MATLNPFELLGADDNDDPTQLIAAAAAAAQKAEAKKSAVAPAGKAAQPAATTKFPTKPAPPSQTVRDARGGGSSARGGFRGGYGGGYSRGPAAAAPSIEDQAQFPSLGGK
ncbi:Hyaluronan / mRNA binding family [Zea mays]|uniref:Hyaluronan / mRNA binding family n=1 Tax=Zea mays TaxID=4577 RepID=A0A1D6NDP5_MAIZE|nr:Hyaluronan / mRNA binding family [Zea mays]